MIYQGLPMVFYVLTGFGEELLTTKDQLGGSWGYQMKIWRYSVMVKSSVFINFHCFFVFFDGFLVKKPWLLTMVNNHGY